MHWKCLHTNFPIRTQIQLPLPQHNGSTWSLVEEALHEIPHARRTRRFPRHPNCLSRRSCTLQGTYSVGHKFCPVTLRSCMQLSSGGWSWSVMHLNVGKATLQSQRGQTLRVHRVVQFWFESADVVNHPLMEQRFKRRQSALKSHNNVHSSYA